MVVFHVPVFALSLQHFYRTLTGYTTAMLIHNARHMIAFHYEENNIRGENVPKKLDRVTVCGTVTLASGYFLN